MSKRVTKIGAGTAALAALSLGGAALAARPAALTPRGPTGP